MTIPPVEYVLGLTPNPAFFGKAPCKLEASCHDRTPFISFTCPGCGADSHVHESQVDGAPEGIEIGAPCSGCGVLLVTRAGELREGFAQMRAEGWID